MVGGHEVDGRGADRRGPDPAGEHRSAARRGRISGQGELSAWGAGQRRREARKAVDAPPRSDAGAVLEKDCVYIVPLLEHLALRRRMSALANPKSSIGRLDVFARVITDQGTEFDRVREGYKRPALRRISPLRSASWHAPDRGSCNCGSGAGRPVPRHGAAAAARRDAAGRGAGCGGWRGAHSRSAGLRSATGCLSRSMCPATLDVG